MVIVAGCGAPLRSSELPPIEPANLIAPGTYNAKIASLRATLARSGVALDTDPVHRYCGSHHGIDRCVVCELAGRADTAGIDPDMIDGIAIAFGRYPTSVLAAAKLEHVALCRRIRYEGNTETPPAGVAISGENRLLLSIEHFVGQRHGYEHFTIEQVVHHELFHLLDHQTLGEAAYDDREWAALNPPGFAYRESPSTAERRPAGFVNGYATTNGLEDRASTFEYLMAHASELCGIAELDPVVAAKTAIVWKRTAKVMGESLLRRHAPCWTERKPTKLVKPAKRAKPFGPTRPEPRKKTLKMR